jgi:hypothetical protein
MNLADVSFQGKSLKQLKLAIPYMNPNTKKQTKIVKSYYLAPDQGWLCHGQTMEPIDDDPMFTEGLIEYDVREPYPALKRVAYTVRKRGEPTFSRPGPTFDITRFVRSAKLIDADFRLSAFGLPEPPGIEWERRTPWWLWLIGSAFALLLVAAAFTWLKRRAMRSRAAAA